mmetsp:Transcript_130097/g.296638  ORF Transcript_130097/g.296638 Transcript_130097/m.296638 type:complete len:343 (+) Transcript_130097:17-1045(+)
MSRVHRKLIEDDELPLTPREKLTGWSRPDETPVSCDSPARRDAPAVEHWKVAGQSGDTRFVAVEQPRKAVPWRHTTFVVKSPIALHPDPDRRRQQLAARVCGGGFSNSAGWVVDPEVASREPTGYSRARRGLGLPQHSAMHRNTPAANPSKHPLGCCKFGRSTGDRYEEQGGAVEDPMLDPWSEPVEETVPIYAASFCASRHMLTRGGPPEELFVTSSSLQQSTSTPQLSTLCSSCALGQSGMRVVSQSRQSLATTSTGSRTATPTVTRSPHPAAERRSIHTPGGRPPKKPQSQQARFRGWWASRAEFETTDVDMLTRSALMVSSPNGHTRSGPLRGTFLKG